jgi:hypothetical protein
MIYDIGNPDPGSEQRHRCGRVELVNGIPTLPPLDNWISNGNIDINKR